MTYTKFHFLLGKLELIDSSRKFSWDGEDFLHGDMEYISYDLILRDKRVSFDVIFNFEARCKYIQTCLHCEYEIETMDVTNVDINIDIKLIESNSNIDWDIKDIELSNKLKDNIIKSLNLN